MMKKANGNCVFHAANASALLPVALLGIGIVLPAPAVYATIANPDEIIVNARRTEEAIQTVPISMTVMNQEMLDEKNVVSAADLANFTPSLNVNTRFGADQASFSIRGFTQELRTAASVAVYFADVVAPRGGGSVTAGDGAGPGSFFDLQNMQVLKGPQGTLFGRNTTGGAIMLTPQEPTTKLEGYLEGSVGNYNMRRIQGVINVPLTDNARARFGIDRQTRDGYLNNVAGVGPDHLADIDYTAGRASLMLDLPGDIQNYTIFSMVSSNNNGSVMGLIDCKPGASTYSTCKATLDKLGNDYYAVASGDVTDPVSKLRQWQLINSTSWEANEAFTVKNILSFADLKQDMVSSVFGSDFQLPTNLPAGLAPLAGAHLSFSATQKTPGMHTNAQKSFVEELRFQGLAFAAKLNWQTGLYFETSKPDGTSGSLSTIGIACDPDSLGDASSSWRCYDPGKLQGQPGAVQANYGTIEYRNMAAYGQATYDITDEFRVTGGLRFTDDLTKGESEALLYHDFASPTLSFTTPPPGGPQTTSCVMGSAALPGCKVKTEQHSEAPTWLIDFDYLPTPDLMAYAKYARGYRQGSVNIFGAENWQTFDPEKVDAYELGMKSSFHGTIRGTFNLALFYNELKDQQLMATYTGTGVSPTTAVLNAGSSTIQGVEAETTAQLYAGLNFSLAYTYLKTKINEFQAPDPILPYTDSQHFVAAGGPLTQSPRHTVVASLSYRLPLPADIGDISLGGSYTFMSEFLATTVGPYGMLPSHHLVNLNASWKGIARSAFDLALFATNVTNEEYRTMVNGLWDFAGAEFGNVGEPRMYGARLKYHFD